MTRLKKVLKLRTVVSSSAGMALATSSYIASLQIATLVAGELAWVSVLVAGVCCLLSALCFSELTSQYPTAAGIKLFIQNAWGEKLAIIIGMFYVVLGISMVGAESFVLSKVMTDSLTMISPEVDRAVWLSVFILFVAYINYRGVKIAGTAEDIMTFTMLLLLALVSVYAISRAGVDLRGAFGSGRFTLSTVLSAAGLGVFLFVGFEWVTPLAEETTDYRMIGRGMLMAIGLLCVVYSLFSVAVWVGLTPEQRASGTPIPHILLGRNLFGTTGVLLFACLSVLASVTSFNAGLLNTSRFTYAMARDNVLPGVFSKLHPDHATPWVAILALVAYALVLSVIIFITGQYLFIIMIAAALECFIYVVMAVCVLRLRKKFPGRETDFRVPLGPVLPVIAAVIFGGLLVGIFLGATTDHSGAVLFQNYLVAVVMGVFFLLCTLYTLLVVPVLKKKAALKAATRTRRRPGRAQGSAPGS